MGEETVATMMRELRRREICSSDGGYLKPLPTYKWVEARLQKVMDRAEKAEEALAAIGQQEGLEG